MSKLPDRDRILRLLSETDGLSSSRIKTELELSDERYSDLRQELIEEHLVEKTRGRGGGIRLTKKGERAAPSIQYGSSTVENEAALYDPFTRFLENQAKEDGVQAVVCATHFLKSRGQWQNPDVTRIAIDHYPHLRTVRVTLTTYEVKQFPCWTVAAVYEAASHHRFSHEAYVVLEWPNSVEFSFTDPTYKLDQIVRECQRFGVGLATLEPYYNSFRLRTRLDPTSTTPDDEDVDAWLEYVFSRETDKLHAYNRLMQLVQDTRTKGASSEPT